MASLGQTSVVGMSVGVQVFKDINSSSPRPIIVHAMISFCSHIDDVKLPVFLGDSALSKLL